MTTDTYMVGRKKYSRPQGLLFADNPGLIDNGKITPDGVEFTDFIILSDHNREPIKFDTERIEVRQRTINGRMRSYHIADKLKISTSYSLLPSRAFSTDVNFDSGGSLANSSSTEQYTADNGAGGLDLLDWYEKHQGSFWVYLSYDKYNNLNNEKDRLAEYVEVVEVFFGNFSYSVENRGATNHDFWNIDFSLEEV